MPINLESYGKRLRVVLKMMGLTQADLADRIGVSQTAVSKWMRGAANSDGTHEKSDKGKAGDEAVVAAPPP